jgi:hypothetical protein
MHSPSYYSDLFVSSQLNPDRAASDRPQAVPIDVSSLELDFVYHHPPFYQYLHSLLHTSNV